MLDEHEWGGRRWRVALIAKPFGDWSLVATEATGAMLRQELGLKVRDVLPGPRGRKCYTVVTQRS